MKLLTGRGVSMKERLKHGIRRFKTLIILVLIVEGVAVYNNPVLLVKQGKALGRHVSLKQANIKYKLIEEAHGNTVMNLAITRDSLVSDGKVFRKVWRDSLAVFKV